VLLDAAVRTGRPLAVAAARDGLCRRERREHGGDSPDFGGETYDDSRPLTGSDRALGLVDFSLFPHLDREDMPDTSLANVEKWAVGIPVPAYAIDDQTAMKVVDGNVEVVSEGHWKLFTPARKQANRLRRHARSAARARQQSDRAAGVKAPADSAKEYAS